MIGAGAGHGVVPDVQLPFGAEGDGLVDDANAEVEIDARFDSVVSATARDIDDAGAAVPVAAAVGASGDERVDGIGCRSCSS